MKKIDFTDQNGVIYLFEIKDDYIDIQNINKHKAMACPTDLIQKQSSVWDYIAEYTELSKDARIFVEKIASEHILILI